jgi:hypothetical protein
MKSKATVTFLGIVIFLLGGVAGAVSHYLYREHLRAAFFKSRPKPPDTVEILARELKLDDGQKGQMKTIFGESRKRYEALSKQFWPQFVTIRNETDQQIRNILHDDQKALYENFLKKAYAGPPSRTPATKGTPPQGAMPK